MIEFAVTTLPNGRVTAEYTLSQVDDDGLARVFTDALSFNATDYAAQSQASMEAIAQARFETWFAAVTASQTDGGGHGQ